MENPSDTLVTFRELVPPLLSPTEIQTSPSGAPPATAGGIVVNACHLIFHMNSPGEISPITPRHAFEVLEAEG